jgi:hypothetical protein
MPMFIIRLAAISQYRPRVETALRRPPFRQRAKYTSRPFSFHS